MAIWRVTVILDDTDPTQSSMLASIRNNLATYLTSNPTPSNQAANQTVQIQRVA